jgi:hypothetical protein
MENPMTNEPRREIPKDMQIVNPEAEMRLRQIEAATQFANSLKDIAPLVNDFIGLVNNLATYRFEGEKQLLAGQDSRHRREILANLLDRQLERLSRTQDKLIDKIQTMSEADKQRYIELLMKSMTDATDLTGKMITEL